MVASVQSVAQLANNAFVRLGFKLRVGSLFDGSDHARHTLDIYGQTRDELLRSFDYDFSQRTIALTLLKSAPAGGYFPPNAWNPAINPPQGVMFEYAFPLDCIKVRVIKPAALFPMNPDPTPNPFQIANDNNFTPPQRVILCNVANAIANYTGQVTDPSTWDVSFTEALAASLARRLAVVLVDARAVQMEMADEQGAAAVSQMDQR